MATFGREARYDDEPWGDRRTGLDGVRGYYSELLGALPDLSIVVNRWHAGVESVVVEATIRGTHEGSWRGLPATGRRVEFALCGIFDFDDGDRLAGERIYYDRGEVLRQLGLFREPSTALGRIVTVLTHPVTVLRALLRSSGR